MTIDKPLGLYGKLPGYGDFVHRNLPSQFINVWDDWLQLFIAGSQEQMAENWLDIYLTSPIWRFVLSAGVIDEHHWAGIVLPSVDQVGRYYPFSLVMPLPKELNPLEFISVNSRWYQEIEELALQALDGQLDVEALLAENNHQKILTPMAYQKSAGQININTMQIACQFEEELPMNLYPHLLDSLLANSLNSYSVWSTQGSENISPCVFTTQGMPQAAQIPAMMDGQWAHWGWSTPYIVKDNLGQQ